MASRDQLGRAGIWSRAWSVAFRSGDRRLTGAVIGGAAGLEELGYQTLWIGQSASVRYADLEHRYSSWFVLGLVSAMVSSAPNTPTPIWP